MTTNCTVCGKPILPDATAARQSISSAICGGCVSRLSETSDYAALLEGIDAPILLMQGNPRQVVSANRKALALFGKKPQHVEGHRGGEVFDCIHSFTEAGCGKDVNCEGCKIKDAIVDTFASANPHHGVSTGLSIKKAGGISNYVLQVSTEKLGDLALVRVERYDADAQAGDQSDAIP